MRRELVLEPVATRGEPRLAHVDRPGVSNELVASTPAPLTSETSTSSFLLIVFLVANRRIVEGVRVSALKG